MAKRVVLAMSGGVDSSAAAVLLKEQGYQVIGLFMRSGESESSCALSSDGLLPVINQSSHRQGCCSAEDAGDARRVADRLGIPFHSLNFQDSFRRIKDYFVEEYLAGRTPNPCVQCNNWLKFGKLWDFAKQVGAEYIATGHYARVIQDAHTGHWQLHRGVDLNKDQSYVLFGIDRTLLPQILFPLGTYQKPAIRELAAESGLKVANKKDSYEICFVPDNDYAGFIQRWHGQTETAGTFVDTQGNVLGEHSGYEQFTVGQRKGLGLAFGEPRFVVRIDPQKKQVVLGVPDDLITESVCVDQTNWLVDEPLSAFECETKLRYRSTSIPCRVTPQPGQRAVLTSDETFSAVAPGQAAVFYQGSQVLGGGWIA
ncbi:MAG: tRNA 2-thiouridine(34) synthase MnmA [Planctomycetaceae bacterium]|nr:tRNA 2-thiouridine(34) synthase MnmA [Planctomycetaceae bacterium]